MDLKNLFLYVNILCIIGYFVIMTYLHIKFKNYNPIFHAVSDYGVGNSKKFQIMSGILSVTGSLSLIAAFMLLENDFQFKHEAIIYLIIRAVTVIGVLIFPTDIEGEKRTKIGLLHYLFAVVQFTAIVKLAVNLTSAFSAVLPDSFLITVLSTLSIIINISIAGVVAGMIIPPVKKIFGLIERIFLFSSAFYFLVLSFLLLNIS